MSRVIAISNLKGGIGKTTTVVNLGAGLALKGARVLLVDVDAQGNLALALGVRPRRTIYDVFVDGAATADCIVPARPNLDLLPADHTLLSAQPVIARRPDWSRALEHALRPVVRSYDFVLVDSGGSLTLLNTNALMCASDILVPTTIEHFSLKSIDMLFDQVNKIKGHTGNIRMIIPTLFDPRVKQSGQLLAELQERYGKLVVPPVRVNVRLSEAPSDGRTIYEYDPRSRGAADYAQLVERVSDMFGFKPSQARANQTPAPTSAPSQAQASQPSQPTTQNTNVVTCPHCGRTLQHTVLAGYRVAFCDHCKYKVQALVSTPRR